ncbi:MAG TPA: tetratricopeptide repeat protein [Rhodothermales bacterium]|nr:tetratricopeptide repeat protein [Rhodothermales bacterium]
MDQKHIFIIILLLSACLFGPSAYAQAPTMEEAQAHLQAEDWEKAAAAFEAILEEDTDNGRAMWLYGSALRQLEQYDKAIDIYTKLDATGSPPIVKVNLGELYALTGQPDDAFAWLEKATAAGFSSQQTLTSSTALAALQEDERFDEILAQADKNARPCAFSEKHRAFDFWVGEWDVINAQGQVAGANSIQKDEQGCLLVERWKGSGGGTGMSINYYDPGKEKWVQQWVASGASVIYLEGELNEDGAMVLEGELTNRNGESSPLRGTWTLLPDGRVRQLFEQTTDGGETWAPWFDGYYVRQGSGEK